jgi:hypothetical protein
VNADEARPARIDLDPDALGRGLSQVVLVVLDIVRELLERQAVRRMEANELTDDEVERLGHALQALRRTLAQLHADLAQPPTPASDQLSSLLTSLSCADSSITASQGKGETQ